MRVEGLCFRRIVVGVTAVALCALASARNLVAQESTAAISGIVIDAQHAALPGVALTVVNDGTGLTRTTVSDATGAYRFAVLPPGRYDLKAELEGFAAFGLKNQLLTVGLDLRQEIVMTIQSVQEAVTVTAAVPLIETTRADVSTVVNEQQIETIPVSTRQTIDLALLQPGTNTDNSAAFRVSVQVGAGGIIARNAFLVDGVTNQQSTGGDSRQDFPQDSIQEFRVNLAQAPAEFGMTTGGVVSIVTKGGSNEYHGEGFEFFRNKALNAMNIFQQQNYDKGEGKPPFNQNNYGATLGGPILTNKLQFLLAADATQTTQDVIVNTGQPQNYAAVSGNFPDNQFRNMFFSRVDGQINSNMNYFVRWGWEWNDVACNGCGGTISNTSGANVELRRSSLVVGHNSVFGSSSVNEFRFQWAPYAFLNGPSDQSQLWTEVGNFSPARYPDATQVFKFPSLTYGTTANKVQIETWWEFHDDFSWVTEKGGNSNWKVGVASIRTPDQQDLDANTLGTWTFKTDQLFNPNNLSTLTNPTQFTQALPPTTQVLQTNVFQAYIQDKWRPVNNLTVDLGVRYDLEYNSFNQNMNMALYPKLVGLINPSSRGDDRAVQPRTGFAWDLTGRGRTVVRGAWGLYNAMVFNGSFGTELSNLLQSNIIIKNPPYPNPYGGLSPLQFASTAPPNITYFNDDVRLPFASTETIGFSQQLTKTWALHVDAVYQHSSDNPNTEDVNTPICASVTVAGCIGGVRAQPQWGQLNQIEMSGQQDYKALFVRVERQFANRFNFLEAYTLASCQTNIQSGTVTDASNPRQDWGPCPTDRRNTLVTSGSVLLPLGFTFGGVWTLRSAMPFSAIAGVDLNGDGNTTDYVPGTSAGQGNRNLNLGLVNAWRAQNGLAPIPASQIMSNRYNSLDVRLSRDFKFGRQKLVVLAQVFNVLGTDNYLASGGLGSYVTNALSPSFGQILTAGNRQQAELAIRYVW